MIQPQSEVNITAVFAVSYIQRTRNSIANKIAQQKKNLQ